MRMNADKMLARLRFDLETDALENDIDPTTGNVRVLGCWELWAERTLEAIVSKA